MNIIYIGYSDNSTTSFHRFSALKRLGHTVQLLDPYIFLSKRLSHPLLGRFHYRTGYRFLQSSVLKWLKVEYSQISYPIDLIWIDSGELFGSETIQWLKRYQCPVLLYNIDDPTGYRDGNRFKSLMKAINHYDLCVTVRSATYKDLIEKGVKRVLQVSRSYDEEAHKPLNEESQIPSEYISDVAFIGTWMIAEKRDEFLLQLVEEGLNISIWGDRWQKSKYWLRLKPFYRGQSLKGTQYSLAIQGAKISLGLLSKGNRDLHTTRSLEIPYAGGLLCAERTDEHLSLYREGEEAVFWSNALECSRVCKSLLENESLRHQIQKAGAQKVRQLGVGNEDICRTIIAALNNY